MRVGGNEKTEDGILLSRVFREQTTSVVREPEGTGVLILDMFEEKKYSMSQKS